MPINNSINEATDVQIFTTPGTSTWTKPYGVQFVYVVCIGGGGGGGGGQVANLNIAKGGCAGGGGGAYAWRMYSASDLSESETVVVGSGGNGGSSGAAGNAGSVSSFSTGIDILSAFGGGGAAGPNNSGSVSGGGGGGGTVSAGSNGLAN